MCRLPPQGRDDASRGAAITIAVVAGRRARALAARSGNQDFVPLCTGEITGPIIFRADKTEAAFLACLGEAWPG